MSRSSLTKAVFLLILFISSLTIYSNQAFACFYLIVNPRYIPADGTTTAPITATLIRSDGGPLGGQMVDFSITYPSFDFGDLDPTSTQTDSAGKATTTYYQPSTPTPSRVRIKADATIQIPQEQGGGTKSLSDTEDIYLVKVDAAVYRPQTTPFNWSTYQIPEGAEETQGAGIRINGDDDNNNSIPDKDETSVVGEDDLIKVTLKADPQPTPSGLEYILKRTNSNIKVWENQTKGTAILDADDEGVLIFNQANIKDVWVEDPIGGNSFLEIQARIIADKTVITFDKVYFYSFTSTIIALGGEGQVPTDPPDTNHGTFQLAKDLYLQGYDVHMYNEDNVGFDGLGAAYNEVQSAVQKRNVSQIAIFGYSHGGGSTYNLAERLTLNGIGIIKYAAYIDAVEDEFLGDMFQEQRRPPGTAYLVNYYQENGSFELGGGPVTPPADIEINVTQTSWGATLGHGDIDDDLNVRNGVANSLVSHVSR